jgi:DnaJ-class molecular chaperone
MSRVGEALLALWARIRPKLPCRRCRGTGTYQGLDCPDCGGSGRV